MTELKPQSPLRRETAVIYRGRPLIIAAHPGFLEIRQKGRRQVFAISWQAIHDCAAKLAAAAARAEKIAGKRTRGKR